MTCTRIGIVNRGEPALRFIRALQEFNLQHKTNIEAVALYTTVDEYSPFVRLADIAICIGNPMRTNKLGNIVNAYCDHELIIQTLQEQHCDAVWPGWGFIAEDHIFVEKLENLGITFLGPSSVAMAKLGDKIAAKYLAEQSNVPLAPWVEFSPNWTKEELISKADIIGYPLMVKASAGGGGRGIRKVHHAEELESTIQQVQQDVVKFFGQGGILLEKCVHHARHIEVQIVATPTTAYAVGVRDCSIQRKNQKVIEEAPSPILPKQIEDLICRSSEKLAISCGYVGVATAEFLYCPADQTCSFLEVNSRLQVEHTITEAVTGLDLVQAQIAIAMGIEWHPQNYQPNGHAIELRLNAEDPEKDFRPAPGYVAIFRPPSGPGVRVDSGISEGMNISEYFDSMIAKIIIWAPTRDLCISRAIRACQEMDAAVEDGATNQAFLHDILRHPEFIEGTAYTNWLDTAMTNGSLVTVGGEKEALVAAAILEYQRQHQENINKFFIQNQDGIPFHFPTTTGQEIELRLRGANYQLSVACWQKNEFLVEIQQHIYRVEFRNIQAHIAEMWMEEQRHKILYSYGSAGITVELDGYSHTIERSTGGVVKAPTPAVIVGLSVEMGTKVNVGDKLCTLEAMKMELGVFATESGIVREVLCQINQQVLIGDALLIIDISDASAPQQISKIFSPPQRALLAEIRTENGIDPLLIEKLDPIVQEKILEELQLLLRAPILGFDVLPQMNNLLQMLLKKFVSIEKMGKPRIWEHFSPILSMFADAIELLDRNVLLDIDDNTSIASHLAFYEFCRQHHEEEKAVLSCLQDSLQRTLEWYGIRNFSANDSMRDALFRLALANTNNSYRHNIISGLLQLFIALEKADWQTPESYAQLFTRVGQTALSEYPFVQDHAIHAHYIFFDRRKYSRSQDDIHSAVQQIFHSIENFPPYAKVSRVAMKKLGRSPRELLCSIFSLHTESSVSTHRLIESLTRRIYINQHYTWIEDIHRNGIVVVIGKITAEEPEYIVSIFVSSHISIQTIEKTIQSISTEYSIDYLEIFSPVPPHTIWGESMYLDVQVYTAKSVVFSWYIEENTHNHIQHRCYKLQALSQGATYIEDTMLQNLHPAVAERIHLDRLQNFQLQRIPSQEHIYAFIGTAQQNPQDQRIFVLAEVFGTFRDTENTPLWEFEKVFFEAIRTMRSIQAKRTKKSRIHWNRLFFHIHPLLQITERELQLVAKGLEPYTRDLQLRDVQLHLRSKQHKFKWKTLQLRRSGNHRMESKWITEHRKIQPINPYEMRVVRAEKSGHIYPYEIIRMLEGTKTDISLPHPDMKDGRFQEFDFNEKGEFIPVIRPFGQNTCSVVVGIISNCTRKYPQGLQRVWIGSDSTIAMGSLTEKECSRIIEAIELAKKHRLSIEWIPISAGAMISMNSGTENLDWTAKVLEAIIKFTQDGGVINLIVHGINVGAQSYWNAEASMLMHTKGVLIMTPQASMVLTGKKALDFSGGVSAEDERGIGGVERIMAPNGQAQFMATDLGDAYHILFEYYRHCHKVSTEQHCRTQPTKDNPNRDISQHPYTDKKHPYFTKVGDIFSLVHNPERKKPFAIRQVMQAVIDQDSAPLERFTHLHQGESAVVWLAHIGGYPVTLLGIESQQILRRGRIPIDGPDSWTGGTLFPQSSKKLARAINSASNVHPIVVLANLSGFDGSPESLRKLQLEYGAEIGRAVVNFQGPIIFVVISRYHGGAYVVFSKALNPNITAIAIEGSFASVIGGAPAAAVVFPRKVEQLVNADSRIVQLREDLSRASGEQAAKIAQQLKQKYEDITLEKRGIIAQEFDSIHNVERAIQVGSLDAVISTKELRPHIIHTIQQAQT